MRYWLGPIVVTAVGVAVVVMLVWAITYKINKQHQFERRCATQNGHTISVSRGEICIGADGRYLGQE